MNVTTEKPIPHGTAGGYTNHHCRCDLCREAFSKAMWKAGVKRRERGLPKGDPRHGTANGYDNYGCRCDACKLARKQVRDRARKRRDDPTAA